MEADSSSSKSRLSLSTMGASNIPLKTENKTKQRIAKTDQCKNVTIDEIFTLFSLYQSKFISKSSSGCTVHFCDPIENQKKKSDKKLAESNNTYTIGFNEYLQLTNTITGSDYPMTEDLSIIIDGGSPESLKSLSSDAPKPSSTRKNIHEAFTNISEVVTDIPGAVTDIPEVVTDIPGAVTDIPGAVTDIPEAVTDIPGAVTNIPEAVTDIPVASCQLIPDCKSSKKRDINNMHNGEGPGVPLAHQDELHSNGTTNSDSSLNAPNPVINTFQCKVHKNCSRHFTSDSSKEYKAHIESLRCIICDQTYISISDLWLHTELSHFGCCFCSSYVKSLDQLFDHVTKEKHPSILFSTLPIKL